MLNQLNVCKYLISIGLVVSPEVSDQVTHQKVQTSTLQSESFRVDLFNSFTVLGFKALECLICNYSSQLDAGDRYRVIVKYFTTHTNYGPLNDKTNENLCRRVIYSLHNIRKSHKP